MNRPAARLAGAAVAVLLLACGSDDDGDAPTTTSSTTTTTQPDPGPVTTEEVGLVSVDLERLEVHVLAPGAIEADTLALDPAAEVTVQGADGPVELALDQLPDFVEQRLAELGGTQEVVPFSIEVTGSGSDRRVTALQEVPPG